MHFISSAVSCLIYVSFSEVFTLRICRLCKLNLSLVKVAEGPPFRKGLFIQFTVCSICIMLICNISFSHFGFHDRILVLTAQVPGHCFLFIFEFLSE